MILRRVSSAMGRVWLGLGYLVVFTTIGFWLRVSGRSAIRMRPSPAAVTYWADADPDAAPAASDATSAWALLRTHQRYWLAAVLLAVFFLGLVLSLVSVGGAPLLYPLF